MTKTYNLLDGVLTFDSENKKVTYKKYDSKRSKTTTLDKIRNLLNATEEQKLINIEKIDPLLLKTIYNNTNNEITKNKITQRKTIPYTIIEKIIEENNPNTVLYLTGNKNIKLKDKEIKNIISNLKKHRAMVIRDLIKIHNAIDKKYIKYFITKEHENSKYDILYYILHSEKLKDELTLPLLFFITALPDKTVTIYFSKIKNNKRITDRNIVNINEKAFSFLKKHPEISNVTVKDIEKIYNYLKNNQDILEYSDKNIRKSLSLLYKKNKKVKSLLKEIYKLFK